ncbi:hypothetical protein LEP3755_56980 [Leptolyngbya sp. NIES-3755]|nr:hypothetical protein LEP3755_56980 [Leptolyngbya sp. NIES-3755]
MLAACLEFLHENHTFGAAKTTKTKTTKTSV